MTSEKLLLGFISNLSVQGYQIVRDDRRVEPAELRGLVTRYVEFVDAFETPDDDPWLSEPMTAEEIESADADGLLEW